MKLITIKKYEEILKLYRERRIDYAITVRPLSKPGEVVVYHTPIDFRYWGFTVHDFACMSVTWNGGEEWNQLLGIYHEIQKYARNGGTMVPTIKSTPDSYEIFTPFTIPFFGPLSVFSPAELSSGFVLLGEERWDGNQWEEHWAKKQEEIVERGRSEKPPMKIIMTKDNKWYEENNPEEIRRNINAL